MERLKRLTLASVIVVLTILGATAGFMVGRAVRSLEESVGMLDRRAAQLSVEITKLTEECGALKKKSLRP